MARIRTIKPEFWGDPKTAQLSIPARLLLIGLLNESDDEGRQLASAKRIAGALFPHDDNVTTADVAGWLDELERVGFVRRYTVDGACYLDIPGFAKHQRISKPTPSRLPPHPVAEESRTDSATSRVLTPQPVAESPAMEVEVEVEVDLGSGSGSRKSRRAVVPLGAGNSATETATPKPDPLTQRMLDRWPALNAATVAQLINRARHELDMADNRIDEAIGQTIAKNPTDPCAYLRTILRDWKAQDDPARGVA